MIRTTSLKVAAASGALVLGGAVAAAAVTTPDEAEDGLTTAEEQTGFDLPASEEDHPTKDDHPGGPPEGIEGDEEVSELEDTEEIEVEDNGEGPVDNHGAVVSDFATSTELTGREKGQAIAEVASSNAGDGEAGAPEERPAPPVETPNQGGTDTADQASGGASSAGAGNAGGRP